MKVGSTPVIGIILAGSLFAAPVSATELSPGDAAGAVRSADYPCAHVAKVDPAGENTWLVQCNSGTFRISRDPEGRFEVTQTTGKAEQ